MTLCSPYSKCHPSLLGSTQEDVMYNITIISLLPSIETYSMYCNSVELQSSYVLQICANHELVVKKFACFWSETSSRAEGDGDCTPVSLAWDIYSSPHQILEMNGCCPVKAPPADIFARKEKKEGPQTGQSFSSVWKMKNLCSEFGLSMQTQVCVDFHVKINQSNTIEEDEY